jgi:hypothetical protein
VIEEIEEIDGFICVMVQIGDHVGDLRYFRVVPRIGESVEHVYLQHGQRSYRVVDVWHEARHPTRAPDLLQIVAETHEPDVVAPAKPVEGEVS